MSAAARRIAVWRRALMASAVAACLSGAGMVHGKGHPADSHSAPMPAVRADGRLEFLEPDAVPGTAWSDAGRLSAYMRLHRAADASLMAMAPLAAYGAAAVPRVPIRRTALVRGSPRL